MKKRLLFFFVGLVCSLGMYAEDETFGITRTIASSETTTDKNTSGAAVTGKKVSDDIIVDECDDVVVALAHKVESDMTDKARLTYWYNGSSIQCYVDKGTHNYRNSTKTLGDTNYFAFTMTVAEGKALNIKSITGDIIMDGDNTPYQMAIVDSEGTEVYTSITKIGKKSESALKTVSVSDLTEEVQAALTGMTGKVTVKMRWTNTANTGKYCVIKDFNVVAEVTDAAAQTKYTKPSISQGAYDMASGSYAVTLSTQNNEDGVINYTVGSGDKVSGVASGTTIKVVANTKITATVSGSSFDDSDEATFTTSAAPGDGQATTPTTGNTYSSNTSYDLGAITIPGACIAGQINSGSTPINGSIKTRCNQALTNGTGFYVNVNEYYTITSIKIEGCSNQTGANNCTAVYVDGNKLDGFESVALPLAAKDGQAGTINVENIMAQDKIEFQFDQTYQGQMNITITYLVPVYITTNPDAGYGTVYYEKELVCPVGTKAYTGEVNYGDKITLGLTELADGIIPANTPAVIEGNGGLFTVGISKAEAVTSDLKGTATALATSEVAGTVCVLGYENETVGFYKFNGETLAANKAYLVFEDAPPAKINIIKGDDNVTGISNIKTQAKKGVMYNIAGQRVNANAKGLVIVNGKVVNMK